MKHKSLLYGDITK